VFDVPEFVLKVRPVPAGFLRCWLVEARLLAPFDVLSVGFVVLVCEVLGPLLQGGLVDRPRDRRLYQHL
jgi:hypothetical protein